MKLFMTGITGRIGSALARELLGRDVEVHGLVMPGDPLLDRARQMGAQIHVGSLSDEDVIAQAVRGADAVVHLAALISYLPQDNEVLYETNVHGTYNVLEAAVAHADQPAHIVFASTDATYPTSDPRYRPVDETHPQQPTSLYGLTKVMGEEMTRFFGTKPGFSYTITRFSHTQAAHEVIDPHGTFSHRIFYLNGRLRYLKQQGSPSPQVRETIAILEELAADDEPLLLPRDSEGHTQVSEVTDARDIAQGLRLVLERPEARNEVFNLGPAAPYSMAEAIPYMARATGRRYVEAALPIPMPFVQTSNFKARMLLGYKPKYTLYEMIDEAVAASEATAQGQSANESDNHTRRPDLS